MIICNDNPKPTIIWTLKCHIKGLPWNWIAENLVRVTFSNYPVVMRVNTAEFVGYKCCNGICLCNSDIYNDGTFAYITANCWHARSIAALYSKCLFIVEGWCFYHDLVGSISCHVGVFFSVLIAIYSSINLSYTEIQGPLGKSVYKQNNAI